MARTVDIGHSLVEITPFSVQHSDGMAPPKKTLPAPSKDSVTIFAAAPNGLSSWTEHYDGDYGSMFRKIDFGRPKLWPDGSSTDPAPVLALSVTFCVRTDPRSQSAWVLAIPADRTSAGTASLPRIGLECSHDIVAAAISPSERFIVGGTHGGRVRVWSTKDGRLLHEFVEQHRDVITAVAVQIAPPELHVKGVGFIAATWDSMWRVHIPSHLCWSTDGLTFLSVSDRGGIDGRRIRIVDKSVTDQDDV